MTLPTLPLPRRSGSVLLLACLLAACGKAPAYKAPEPAAPAAFEGAASVKAQATSRHWWTSFRDPVLDQLVATGLAQNLSVAQAVERITEAKAAAGISAANGRPELDLSASTGMTDPTSGASVRASAATSSLSWMIDLFGGAASSRASSKAGLGEAFASAEVARIVMTSEVATAYVDLRYYQNRMALTRDSRTSRAKSAELVHSAFGEGAATRLDTLRADQLVASADALLPGLEVGYATALNRLATLTGQPSAVVAAQVKRGGGQPVPRLRASVALPAEVLRHRPDVIVAERQLASAYAAVGVAEADLYPSLTLTGSITSSGLDGGSFETVRSFGPRVTLPLFNGGRLRNALRGAESRADQARLAWRETVLTAVEEIQTALAAYGRDGRNMAAQEKLLSISTETLDLARSSFALGQTDFLSVLEAERSLLDARAALAEANRDRALNYIRLSAATVDGVSAP